MRVSLEALEQRLGYSFRNRELLRRALTHSSWVPEHLSVEPEGEDNEQLEFLGDSILGFVVSESLIRKNPLLREGQLSQWKAHLVSSSHLHTCALALDIGVHLLLGKGEEQNGGRERKSLLSNALEAIIAAMYLDGGMEAVRPFLEAHVLGGLSEPEQVELIGGLNLKSVLQEKAQALGLPVPRYVTVQTAGPDHAKVFTVEARIGDKLVSRATGTSKKAASQRAAGFLIDRLSPPEVSQALSPALSNATDR